MSFRDRFHAAVAEYLRDMGYDVSSVSSVSQDEAGGCDTCGPDIQVDVYFYDSKDRFQIHTYYGSLDGFLDRLP